MCVCVRSKSSGRAKYFNGTSHRENQIFLEGHLKALLREHLKRLLFLCVCCLKVLPNDRTELTRKKDILKWLISCSHSPF